MNYSAYSAFNNLLVIFNEEVKIITNYEYLF